MARPQLLLLEDVYNLGRKGEVVAPKAGFARNFLLPQRKALIADKGTLRMQEKLQEERRQQAIQDRKDSEAVADKLNDQVFSIDVKVDPDGHMYGSVGVADVIRLVQEETGIELEKRAVILAHPMKSTGVHSVEVRLKEEVTCSIQVKVIPEGGVLEEEAAEGEGAPEGEAATEEGGSAAGGGVVVR